MRKKDKKKRHFGYQPYECTAVEEYLEEMARKGWFLESINMCIFKFKKIEPKKIKYSVDVFEKLSIFDKDNSDLALEYREYCERAGWKYIGQNGKVQIFYSEDYDNIMPIHTDAEVKFKTVFKASFFNILLQLVLVIVFGFNICIQLSGSMVAHSLGSNMGLLTLALMVSCVLINFLDVINFFKWAIKAKRKLRENKYFNYNTYKQLIHKNRIKKTYCVILLFFMFGAVLTSNNIKNNMLLTVGTIVVGILLVLTLNFIRKFINRREYSRENNIMTSIVGYIISIVLCCTLIMGLSLNSVFNKDKDSDISSKVVLDLTDFGYKEENSKDKYYNFENSIIASNSRYGNNIHGEKLSYSLFESNHPWVIKFYEKKLLKVKKQYYKVELLNEKMGLYKNVKVYSYGENNQYLMISKNKIVDISNDFTNINDSEFLDIVYKKVF